MVFNNPLNISWRGTAHHYDIPKQNMKRRPEMLDVEKFELTDSEEEMSSSDDSDEYSSPTSPVTASSRDSSISRDSGRPMLSRSPRSNAQKRATVARTLSPRSRSAKDLSYRIPEKIIRCLCWVLIGTIIIFIATLIRMSVVSARRVESGDSKPPPPPPTWESFDFLRRYYGGIGTLVPLSKSDPEYPRFQDEGEFNETEVLGLPVASRDIPKSRPYNPYPNYASDSYLREYMPSEECFLDKQNEIRIPSLQYYEGRPAGFPDNVIGSYELLNMSQGTCFERYGRLGPYGHGYSLRSGGMGTGQHGDLEGSASVWETVPEVNYNKVDWGIAQRSCVAANAARFKVEDSPYVSSMATEVHFSDNTAKRPSALSSRDDRASPKSNATSPENSTAGQAEIRKLLPRTAVVVRTWDEKEYEEEDILYLRALLAELALGSRGEYEVHLLVEVKDDTVPVWADARTYDAHLQRSVPAEFRGIATLWSQTQMLMYYQGLRDEFVRGPELPVHGSYRGLDMALQHFAQTHGEYDFFWHWEMDVRYTGHFYDLFGRFAGWAAAQPRKLLWERNARFYVPAVHGSWDDFSHMVRVQTELGAESAENIWAGLGAEGRSAEEGGNGAAAAPASPSGTRPIWGPERPTQRSDWFETENDPVPPTSHERDRYEWGVGEEADLIVTNPIFDPAGTSWRLTRDLTGYNHSSTSAEGAEPLSSGSDDESSPPRRAAIITAARLSRRLLTTMHRETALKKHHGFPEMWPATAALHHGYKAVSVPHPAYVDRAWPVAYLAATLNAGRDGAAGGGRASVFGQSREHNFRGSTWYYDAGFAPNLWRRWLGLRVDGSGGEAFETVGVADFEGRPGASGMRGGEGRMCLPEMLIHPVKGVEMPVEEVREGEEEEEGRGGAPGDPAA